MLKKVENHWRNETAKCQGIESFKHVSVISVLQNCHQIYTNVKLVVLGSLKLQERTAFNTLSLNPTLLNTPSEATAGEMRNWCPRQHAFLSKVRIGTK